MNKFLEAIYDMIEIINGERPKPPSDKDWETVRSGEDRRSKDRGTSDRRAKGYTEEHTQQWLDSVELKRARDEMGRYIGDDPTTKDVNEAWVSPFPTPKPSIQWTRKQLIDYCNEFAVLHSSDDSKLQLLEKIKEVYPDDIG